MYDDRAGIVHAGRGLSCPLHLMVRQRMEMHT